MKRILIWTLLGLDVLLLAMLLGWRGQSAVMAQVSRGGEYLIAPAQLTVGSTEVLMILDSRSGILTYAGLVSADSRISSGPSIDLNRVFQGGGATPERRRRY